MRRLNQLEIIPSQGGRIDGVRLNASVTDCQTEKSGRGQPHSKSFAIRLRFGVRLSSAAFHWQCLADRRSYSHAWPGQNYLFNRKKLVVLVRPTVMVCQPLVAGGVGATVSQLAIEERFVVDWSVNSGAKASHWSWSVLPTRKASSVGSMRI